MTTSPPTDFLITLLANTLITKLSPANTWPLTGKVVSQNSFNNVLVQIDESDFVEEVVMTKAEAIEKLTADGRQFGLRGIDINLKRIPKFGFFDYQHLFYFYAVK